MNCPKCSNPLLETGDGYLVCSACGAHFKKKVQEQIIPMTEADERARELEQLNSKISELEQKQRDLEQAVKNRPQQIVVGGAVRPGESKFTATVFDLFIQKLFLVWMTLVSCGIAYPWLKCHYERFMAEHTYINGKQQRFDGKGGELAAKYLLWLFLSAITFGIYSIWLGNNVRKWVASHTHFEGENGESSYDGSAIKMWAYNWLARLAKACTLNLATPWVTCMQERYIAKHTIVDDHQIEFNGTGGGLFKKNVLWVVLTIATCGVFSIWLHLQQEQWRCSNVAIEGYDGMMDFGTSAAPLSEEERQARAEAKRLADEAAKAKRAQEKQAKKELRKERLNTPGYKAATALFTIAVLALVGGIICMALCYALEALSWNYTAIVVCSILFSLAALSLFAGCILASKKSKRKAMMIAAVVLIVCSIAGISGGIYGTAGIVKEKNDPFFYEYDDYNSYWDSNGIYHNHEISYVISTDDNWGDSSVVDAKFALQRSLTRYDIPSHHNGYPVTRIESLDTTTWLDDEGNTVHGNDTLEYLYIPYTVTSISYGALDNLPKLSHIEVDPDNPVYYSQNGILFRRNSDYSTIYGTLQIEHIPQGLTGSITLPDELRYIPDRAFRNIEDVTSVVIPDGVVSIGAAAFAGCSNLTQVTIPSSVIQIEVDAFARCTSLESITLPDNIKTIGDGAFYNCTALESITLPDGLTTIGNHAFYNCSALDAVTIPDEVTSIGIQAFANCSSLESLTVPESVEYLGYEAFMHCTELTNVKWNAESCELGISSDNSLYYDYLHDSSLDGLTFYMPFTNCSKLSSVTIGRQVTSLPYYIFAGCTNLTDVHFSNNSKLSSISSGAFFGCSSLGKISLPSSVTSIDSQAFTNCSAIREISIPSSVTSIGEAAFAGCSALTDITIPYKVTDIGEGAFSDCSKLATVTWNARYCNTYNSYELFDGCGKLKTIVIDSDVYSLPDKLFKDCTSILEVTIDSTQYNLLGDDTFDGCYNISKITAYSATLAGSVAKQANPTSFDVIILSEYSDIGSSAFYNCSGLRSITIPDSVTSIGEDAFYNCSGLTSISIPDSVTSIGKNAFYGCNNISKVYITDLAKWCAIDFGNASANPLYYAHKLYLNNSLVTDLDIPDSVTSIGAYAFYNCTNLTSISIPDNVTSIGTDAFYGYTGIERTFSFISNGGTSCSEITGVYISTLPTPTRSGYTFAGWYDNADLEGDAVSAPYFGASGTLYAKWSSTPIATGTSFSTAKTATTGTTYTVNITTGGQMVYYKFVPTSTKSYTIQSTGSKDTVAYLYDSSQSQLTYNDDGESNNNFKLTYTLTAGYTYYIGVRIYDTSNTGTFYFTIS